MSNQSIESITDQVDLQDWIDKNETPQDRIAQNFGYNNAEDQEADEQYQVEVNWHPKDGNAKTGSIFKDDKGILQFYWYPSEEHPDYGPDDEGYSYAYTVEDWYPVPKQGEVEAMCRDGIALDPCRENELETDHPDGWIRLLGLI